jgi:hypothetical protein
MEGCFEKDWFPGGEWLLQDERVQDMVKIVLGDNGSVGTTYKSREHLEDS